jgi:phage-related protein
MSKWRIVFYATDRGEKPVETFIAKQDKPTIAKIIRNIDLLQQNGPSLGMPFSKYMGENLHELRIRGKNEVRIFYFIQIGDLIVLLHAFNKRTQKTPTKELSIAIKRKNDLT